MDSLRETRNHERPHTGPVMRRLIRLCLVTLFAAALTCALAAALAFAPRAQAEEFRFPKTGQHFFQVDLPKTWRATTDKSGGLLLVPPSPQHAMIYLGVLTDEKLRGKPLRAVATAIGKPAGVEMGGKEDDVRIAGPDGKIVRRGAAFFGDIPAKRGLRSRRARIAVFPLAPDTWAHIWTVTQPGINAAETKALDAVLNAITLVGGT
jgi:hypothetical protein